MNSSLSVNLRIGPSRLFRLFQTFSDFSDWPELSKSRSTYSEEVFRAHGSQLGEGLDGEDGREEVVALLQQALKERGPGQNGQVEH